MFHSEAWHCVQLHVSLTLENEEFKADRNISIVILQLILYFVIFYLVFYFTVKFLFIFKILVIKIIISYKLSFYSSSFILIFLFSSKNNLVKNVMSQLYCKIITHLFKIFFLF